MQTDILKKKNENKYFVFHSTDENKELLKKYTDVSNGIKSEIKAINGAEENDYDWLWLFNSDNDLPLNKPLKFHAMTIIIRSVFKEDGKLYPQFFFRWHFVWILKMLQYHKIDISELIDVNKTSASSVFICFVIIGTLKMLNLSLNHMFVTNVTMYWWLSMSKKHCNIECKRSWF